MGSTIDYQARFTGWDNLTQADLLVAYRKAKVDCFFEKGFPSAINFANYEQNLLENIDKLLEQLKEKSGFREIESLLGEFRIVPKKLSIKPKPNEHDDKNGHTHFSNPKRAFAHLIETQDLTPEFRIVGDFPVNAHIVSALWINTIGYKFDACLGENAYGSRLRKIRNNTLDKESKDFHITAIGSFVAYFEPYQRWRNDGLKAIRVELEQEPKRQILAVSLDLKSYYHQIDPLFIAEEKFQNEIGLQDKLSDVEMEFTRQLATFLSKWSEQASNFASSLQSEDKKSKIGGGLVIGLTASRVIANVLLHKWDRLIREKLTPIYYGRYVDDMFLVLHDPSTVHNTRTLMEFLAERFSGSSNQVMKHKVEGDDKFWEINLSSDYQKESKIQFQDGKQKLFILEGQAGCDLLDSIEKEIRDLSSEHRLMPTPDQLEHTTAARVLSAAGKVGEEADTMRRADGLTIRRLSWSLQLRHVDTLAHDLPKKEWKKERDEFYQFAHNHVLRADKIIEHYAYLPRLLGFAISLEEWQQADEIVRRTFEAFDLLAKNAQAEVVINGVKCDVGGDTWLCHIKCSLTFAFIDVAARSYPIQLLLSEDKLASKANRLSDLFKKQLSKHLAAVKDLSKFRPDYEGFFDKALWVAKADLAKKPYKHLVNAIINNQSKTTDISQERDSLLLEAFRVTNLLSVDDLTEFLRRSQSNRLKTVKCEKISPELITPFMFPTRPYKPEEIAELVPACVGLDTFSLYPSELWAKYVRALRGVWVNPVLLNDEPKSTHEAIKPSPRRFIRIGTQTSKTTLVAITNIATSEESWAATAFDKPDLTIGRYSRLAEIVNQAIQLRPRPKYLILPELSLPLAWVDSIANRLLNAGISLIAGTEYRHSKEYIHSEAYLALADNRLGYPSSVRIWQPKLEPAVSEDEKLIRLYGKTWKTFDVHESKKPVYSHNGFHFGVMVCSELQNSKARVEFQGEVDALLVLSWNPDLETFSALIESSALDVHAYTILVNNRTYGDSRVRVPAKKSFQRDLARIRGGKNDFCVAVELDLDKLRSFQSREKRWPKDDDPFKPVPEGFEFNPASPRNKVQPK